MQSTIDSLVKSSQKKYQSGNFSDSIQLAKEAVNQDPENVNGWWYASLSYFAINDIDNAYECVSNVIDLAPNFANGWAKYAAISQKYFEDDLTESAKSALERALEIDPEYLAALNALAYIYSKSDSGDLSERYNEIRVLSSIKGIEGLTPFQLNRLGILHYSTRNFLEAINVWEENVNAPTGTSLFNLGLAFNHPEVSQDADAIDIWRIAFDKGVLTEKVENSISGLLPRLLKLSKNANEDCDSVLSENQYYDVYLNPFLLLDFKENIELSGDFDFKNLQKLRKRLIHEIELEDGVVHWLEGANITKSQAIGVCDELHDEKKRYFHALVFNNKPLLNFLSKGKHFHFCVQENYSPTDLIEVLDDKNTEFKSWLSKPFSAQFDRVLSMAIRKKLLFIVEVMLDGRRWVLPEYNERCFKTSKKELNTLLSKLDELSKSAEKVKVSYERVKRILESNGLLQMLNLIPSFFWEQQDHAVNRIRQIALSNYNNHNDAELSKKIIDLTDSFDFKSDMFKERISDDVEIINSIIEEKRKDEVHLVFGNKKIKFSITENGITHGEQYISTQELVSLNWGSLLTRTSSDIKNEAVFNFKSQNGNRIRLASTFYESNKEAKKYNSNISDAIFAYLIPSVLQRLQVKLDSNNSVNIGHLTLTREGVKFESGWLIFSSQKFIKWSNYKAKAENGELTIYDTQNRDIQTSVKISDVDNSIMLLFIGDERE